MRLDLSSVERPAGDESRIKWRRPGRLNLGLETDAATTSLGKPASRHSRARALRMPFKERLTSLRVLSGRMVEITSEPGLETGTPSRSRCSVHQTDNRGNDLSGIIPFVLNYAIRLIEHRRSYNLHRNAMQ